MVVLQLPTERSKKTSKLNSSKLPWSMLRPAAGLVSSQGLASVVEAKKILPSKVLQNPEFRISDLIPIILGYSPFKTTSI